MYIQKQSVNLKVVLSITHKESNNTKKYILDSKSTKNLKYLLTGTV